MIINKMPIKYNYSSRKGVKPIFIVVHDTGNIKKGSNAMAHYKYFSGGNRNASAHYFVDDREIVELIEVSNASWHCGDGRGRYGITNSNSIGVELCINEDSNWNDTFNNGVKLVKFLMEFYGISKNRVVRHYDASRKICPSKMSADNWKQWWIFKEML